MISIPYMFFFKKKTFTIFVSAMFLKLKIHSEINLVSVFLKQHVQVLACTCLLQNININVNRNRWIFNTV